MYLYKYEQQLMDLYSNIFRYKQTTRSKYKGSDFFSSKSKMARNPKSLSSRENLLESEDIHEVVKENRRDGIPLSVINPHHQEIENAGNVTSGVDQNSLTDKSDLNTLLRSSIKNRKRHIYTVQQLLDQKMNVNSVIYEGSSSVHLACQDGDVDILYLIITRGGDVNAKDNEGKTPTIIAVENRNDDCINVLATAGANLDDKDDEGNAALIIAAKNGETNAVRELITNGASYDITDNDGRNALEWAIMKKKDGAAANIIRLGLKEEYLEKYIDRPDIGLLKVVREKMIETLKAMLDHALIQDPENPQNAIIRTKYIDYKPTEKEPSENDSTNKKKEVFLKRIADLGDERIAHNGTVRKMVDRKMCQIGNLYLGFKILFHFLYFAALAYSLIIAANENAPRDSYVRNALNIIRIVTELYVLLYFSYNFVAEGFEVYSIYKNVLVLNEEREEGEREEERRRTRKEEGKEKVKTTNLGSRIKNICNFRIWKAVLGDYFTDTTNYFDLVGLFSVLILIFLRLGNQPLQWEFATIANIINAVRLFQLIALIRGIGPYANIFFQILKSDVPQFVSLYSLYLCMFATSYFIALRVPYTSEGFRNQSLMQDTDRVEGIDNTIYWVFVTAVRILLEGNVYDDVYTYQHLNWSAALLYMAFLFLTVVVFLNIFIAQLSDTYGSVKENAQRAYSWHRLSFIVLIQKSSFLSLCLCYRKRFFNPDKADIKIERKEMYKYYGVHCIKNLNIKHYTEDVEVKEALATIQNQQYLSRKTREISKTYSKVQQKRLKDKGAEKIKELTEKIDYLTKSMDSLMGLFQEKFN